MVEVMKIMVSSFKRSYACTAPSRNAPDFSAGHHQPTPPPEAPGHSQANLLQSLVGSLPLSPRSRCTPGFVCALQESVSPVLCQFSWHYDGVNGNLFPEGLCHTQICCTQSPCPCIRPLLTLTSSGDTQMLKGRFGSVSVWSPGAHKVLFEPSKHLWWVRGLILNVILLLLPSCLGFSLALDMGVSFFGGIQHSPVYDCSAASCNFGVLTEDEHMSFYSALLSIL